MKWPSSLTFIRHAESEYNAMKSKKETIPEWKDFTTLFKEGYNAKNFDDLVFEGHWPSPELRELSRSIHAQLRAMFGDHSDVETPLTPNGKEQARKTGAALRESGRKAPDIVYISPYLRTQQTFEEMASAWPELKDVPHPEEERIREQEHGLQTVYNDWRIFLVNHPDAAVLRKKEGQYSFRYPHGESVCNVRERARDFISMLIREHAETDVLAITHHLTILSTRANLERWSRQQFEYADEHEKPKNCGVTVYEGDPTQGKNGRLILKEYNKVHY